MTNGEKLLAEIIDAHPERRALLLAGAAKLYGEGFAQTLRAAVAQHERSERQEHDATIL